MAPDSVGEREDVLAAGHCAPVMSDTSSWAFLGRKVSKSQVVFFMQVILIYIVVIASIINLTVYKEDQGRLWTALLSSSLGYLLPNPKLKRK